MSVWRYLTDPVTCLKLWRKFKLFGPAEHVTRILGPCAKAGALALPLVAAPAATPLPSLSWGGFGPGAQAAGYGGIGPGQGSRAYAPSSGGGGFNGGVGASAGPLFVPVGTAPPAVSLVGEAQGPGERTAGPPLAVSSLLPFGPDLRQFPNGPLPRDLVPELPGARDLVPDVPDVRQPVPVPEPHPAVVLLPALMVALLLRRRQPV